MVTLVAGWLLAALLLLRLGLLLWNMTRTLWITRMIPGPPHINVVLGNLIGFLVSPDLMIDRMTEAYRKYGSPWRLWMGPVFGVFLGEPEDLQLALTHPALQDKAPIYGVISQILGHGLITMNGADYQRRRKAVSPAFRGQVLSGLIPAFVRHSHSFCKDLEAMAISQEVFDIAPSFCRMALATSHETIFCLEPSGEDEGLEEMVTTVPKTSEFTMYLQCRPWYWLEMLRKFFPPLYKECRDLYASLDRFVRTRLNRKIDSFRSIPSSARRGRESNHAKEEAGDTASRRPTPLLEFLLSSEDSHSLGKEELVGELKHISIAFVGTVTDLLSFLAIALSFYPNVQDCMYQELVSVLGSDPSQELTKEKLQHLEYMERVIMEIMRIFPPVPVFGRLAKDDIRLPSGRVLPQGSTVGTLIRQTHLDERWFPEPFRFDPDRFLSENIKSRPKSSYIPFSLGTRSCIGKNFGKLYLKCVLSTMIRVYRLLPDPQGPKNLKDVRTKFGMSLHPTDGANVRLEKR